MTLPAVTLVLGGARSGKSAHAEALVESQSGPCGYLATAQAHDSEMTARIAEHKARRGPRWQTLEEPLDLVGSLKKLARPDGAVLVDCLTLWVTNLMVAEKDLAAEEAALLQALPQLTGPVVFVSNEVGLGIVPMNKMARDFRDHAGRLNQAVARVADRVDFMAAGLVMPLKTPRQPPG
ncbi:bifunctional adenosylcobinamide kinase/adenosylcobinamide-phosphate guanylyltransferase [Rhodovibrionaceae bacterium A322]